MNNFKFAFFGTSHFSTLILDELKNSGFLPSLIITVPDKPKGRKLVLTAPEAKVWAEKENIPCEQFPFLKEDSIIDQIKSREIFDFFVVASYGKIIPQAVLDIPRFGTLNVHPSLLPKLRGASPIQSAILLENETGTTIIRLDKEMDHGPVVAQEKTEIWNEPNEIPYEEDLENELGKKGGVLLSSILPDWIGGKIKETEQEHALATFCQKVTKEKGEINFEEPIEKNLRKIKAFHVWPSAFYFTEQKGKKIRVIIKRAHLDNGQLILDRVLPEGKKETDYKNFLNSLKN